MCFGDSNLISALFHLFFYFYFYFAEDEIQITQQIWLLRICEFRSSSAISFDRRRLLPLLFQALV